MRACLDSELNRRLRQGGHKTYDKHFTPGAVPDKIVSISEEMFLSINRNN